MGMRKILRLFSVAVLLLGSCGQLWSQIETNRVLSLDGITGAMTIPDSPDLETASGITVETWVFLKDPLKNVAPILTKGDGLGGDSQRSYELHWVRGADWAGPRSSVRFIVFMQGGDWHFVDAPVALNAWTHVAASYSAASGQLKLYTNGVLAKIKAQIKGSLRQTSYPLQVGRTDVEPHFYAKGAVDELRVWSRVKKDDEVSRQMYCRLTGSEEGLAGLWNFDDGTMRDLTGHGHDGKREGGATVVLDPDSGIADPLCHQVRPAVATATVVNGFVVGVSLTDLGWGYTNAPAVYFLGGGGSGAAGVATVQNGVVTGVKITSTGSGYTSAPRVLVAAPPGVPSMSISVKQVQVQMNLMVGFNYKVQSTADLRTWTDASDPFLATESSMTLTFDVKTTGQVFRVVEVP